MAGFLLEKVEGREKSLKEDLPARRALLQRSHKKLDRIHGDIQRSHLIMQKKKTVKLVSEKSKFREGAKG